MEKNKMVNVNDVLLKLFEFFKVNNNLDLAELIKTTPQTISNWKTRNSISAIKKKCRELGIYNEIFGSFSENVLTFSMNSIQKKLNIIETMIKDNKEIEDKFNECLKGFIQDNL